MPPSNTPSWPWHCSTALSTAGPLGKFRPAGFGGGASVDAASSGGDRVLHDAKLPTWPDSLISQTFLRTASFARCINDTSLRRRFAPAAEQAMVDFQLITHTADDEIHHVCDCLRHLVERRHGGQNDGPGFDASREVS